MTKAFFSSSDAALIAILLLALSHRITTVFTSASLRSRHAAALIASLPAGKIDKTGVSTRMELLSNSS
jgi:hypothetical protein